MLYGINSRERDRAGFIADKNRYAPWSGAAMSGRLDCATELGELTLTRTTRRQTSPMGEFRAVYAGTGEPVPGLTGRTCGETLLGVSREVFERSAFIRQSGLAVTQDAGLERRIAALISSGEEDTSYHGGRGSPEEAAEPPPPQQDRPAAGSGGGAGGPGAAAGGERGPGPAAGQARRTRRFWQRGRPPCRRSWTHWTAGRPPASGRL